jgi:hypothetical protein
MMVIISIDNNSYSYYYTPNGFKAPLFPDLMGYLA